MSFRAAAGALVSSLRVGGPIVHCDTKDQPPVRSGSASVQANGHNEDRFRIAHKSNVAIATLADGHGSHRISEFVVDKLPDELFKRGSHTPALITSAFVHVDNLLRDIMFTGKSEEWQAGSCALAAIVNPTGVIVANCGHSRALLVDPASHSHKWVSETHSADSESEQSRLRSLHPDERDVVHCRHKIVELDGETDQIKSVRWAACYVKGRLQATRSFGDFYLKDIRAADVCPSLVPSGGLFTPPYIEAAPTVVTFDRSPGSVLVLASDGLWDYLSPEEVTQVVESLLKEDDSPDRGNRIAQGLVDKALSVAAEATELSVTELKSMEPGIEKRSIHDDITAIVLLL